MPRTAAAAVYGCMVASNDCTRYQYSASALFRSLPRTVRPGGRKNEKSRNSGLFRGNGDPAQLVGFGSAGACSLFCAASCAGQNVSSVSS
jgi:hypothetical protein